MKTHVKVIVCTLLCNPVIFFASCCQRYLSTGKEPVQIEEMDLNFNRDFFFQPTLCQGGANP